MQVKEESSSKLMIFLFVASNLSITWFSKDLLRHYIILCRSWMKVRIRYANRIGRTMNFLLLSVIFAVANAELCIRLLRNHEEMRIVRKIPGRIVLWNRNANKFEQLDAIKFNDSAVCSVDMRKNLHGKTIIVATDLMSPYVLKNANNVGVTGFIGDIWTTLEETLKFKTIYRRAGPSAGQTLMNGQAHALLLATAIYSYTSSYYTYSTPITTNSYALFVQSEGSMVSKWWYSRIFSRKLWFTIFVFVIFVTCIILAMYYLKKNVYGSYVECDGELSSVTFDLLFVLGGISGQGCQKVPTSWSLRLIVLSYLIMGMFLSCGFNSTLTSYLAIRGNSVPLSSLRDVSQKRTHSLCVRNDSTAYIRFTVNGSLRGELADEWKDIINFDCPDMRNSSAISSKLCQPDLTFLEAPDVFLPIYRKVEHKCRMIQMPNPYWSLRIAFLHRRSAAHRRLVDVYLMRLRSAGILKYLEKKWITKEMEKPETSQWSPFQAVEYGHIYLASVGFATMTLLSVIVCILENIWYRLQPRSMAIDLSGSLNVRTPDESDVLELYRKFRVRGSRRRKPVLRNRTISSNVIKRQAWLA